VQAWGNHLPGKCPEIGTLKRPGTRSGVLTVMRPTLPRFYSALFAGFVLLAGASRAQTLAFSIAPSPNGTAEHGGRQPFLGTAGLYFTLNAPLTISSLGYWDDGQDGLNISTAITVAIFDRTATGSPLTSFTFTGSTGTLSGGIVPHQYDSNPNQLTDIPGQFRLANLNAPVVLPAGQYALATWGFNGSNQILNGSNDPPPVLDVESFSGNLTFDGSAFSSSSGVYPTTLDPGGGVIVPLYVAATFSPDVVSAIPEPAEVALIFATVAFAGAVIVRRQKRAAGVR
jgi:hypothetical protein